MTPFDPNGFTETPSSRQSSKKLKVDATGKTDKEASVELEMREFKDPQGVPETKNDKAELTTGTTPLSAEVENNETLDSTTGKEASSSVGGQTRAPLLALGTKHSTTLQIGVGEHSLGESSVDLSDLRPNQESSNCCGCCCLCIRRPFAFASRHF